MKAGDVDTWERTFINEDVLDFFYKFLEIKEKHVVNEFKLNG